MNPRKPAAEEPCAMELIGQPVNMRDSASKWSTEGALNVTKVRLAYYYNGLDA